MDIEVFSYTDTNMQPEALLFLAVIIFIIAWLAEV